MPYTLQMLHTFINFHLDETAYDAARLDWEAEHNEDQKADEEAAA